MASREAVEVIVPGHSLVVDLVSTEVWHGADLANEHTVPDAVEFVRGLVQRGELVELIGGSLTHIVAAHVCAYRYIGGVA